MHNVSKLCLRAHTLKVETAAWLEDGSRVKSKSKSLRWKSPACIKERLSTSAHTSQSPTKNEKKEKQQRPMRIRRVVSYAIRPAPSPPEASRSTSNPHSGSPIITVAVVNVYCMSCFCDLVMLFIAWQCILVASCALCAWGCPSLVEELWCTKCRLCPRLQEV
jgi:hypothetical protein